MDKNAGNRVRVPRVAIRRALEAATAAAGMAADGDSYQIIERKGYFGYLNSGAAFSASLVVFIDASHLSFLLS